VVHCEVKSGRGAEYADTVKALPQPILDALRSKGVHRLFRHQVSSRNSHSFGLSEDPASGVECDMKILLSLSGICNRCSYDG
jgi:hypothetical protein